METQKRITLQYNDSRFPFNSTSQRQILIIGSYGCRRG